MRLLDLIEAALKDIDVQQRHENAIRLVFRGLVWPQSEGVPVALSILHVPLEGIALPDHFSHQRLQIVDCDIGLDVPDWPPYIARNKVQQTLRGRSKSPDAPVASQHHDRKIDPNQQVDRKSTRLNS